MSRRSSSARDRPIPFRGPTDLDDVAVNVPQTHVDLLAHKGRGCDVDVLDPLGVLRRQGRGRRHRVAAVGRQDLLIGLESAVTTWSIPMVLAPQEG